ncbi:rubredoxin [Magnetospirillum fulvum]|nr:rubredoxin [Magnetospirillum fulvum]
MSESAFPLAPIMARDTNGALALWVCNRCGHVYSPAEGEPLQGIPPGVPFELLPEDWLCPHCGAPHSLFIH